MENPSASKRYTVIRGFIRGKAMNFNPVYGVFVAIVDSTTLLYLNEHFSSSPIDQNLPWSDLLALVEEPENTDEELARCEKELHSYIDYSRVFIPGTTTVDDKELERKITYFCSDTLGINAMTFLERSEVGESDILNLIPFFSEHLAAIEKKRNEAAFPVHPVPEEGEEADDFGFGKNPQELFISCEPLLDPVSGIASTELEVGDDVYARLPDHSAFFKFFRNSFPDFDGIITGEVTGIHINENGIAIVALNLADGVSGALKISGKVRIQAVSRKRDAAQKHYRGVSTEIILAGGGVILFLGIMGALIYFFS